MLNNSSRPLRKNFESQINLSNVVAHRFQSRVLNIKHNHNLSNSSSMNADRNRLQSSADRVKLLCQK